ncbi:MAG: hypothetical protein Q8L27_00155 [archaeon]|nr:hypothetical protein [archaeon]
MENKKSKNGPSGSGGKIFYIQKIRDFLTVRFVTNKKNKTNKMGVKKNKSGQITIFVIIAIMIVAVIGIIFQKQIINVLVPPTPGEMIPKTCIENAVKESLNITMNNGGKINPELYFRYNNETINYVCYTSEWYQTCIMQVPFLKQAIEAEAEVYSQKKIDACFENMEQQLQSRGYTVKLTGSKTPTISLESKRVSIRFYISAQINKGDDAPETYSAERFTTVYPSNSYNIIMIASSIQNFEARYGDSVIDTYMGIYPELKVEKMKQSDGTKLYIITDRNTLEKMKFATRSLAWPPGYGIV